MDARKEIIRIGTKLEQKSLIVASDGNISFRLESGRFIITPSGISKGSLLESELIVVDDKGNVLDGKGQPSGELLMHLAIYNERPDVKAVIHAHPINVTALTVAGVSLDRPVLPEVVMKIGNVPLAPYATPCTKEGADSIRKVIKKSDVIMLDRHGSVTVGDSLESAFHKLEKLEQLARIVMLAKIMGKVKTLPDKEVKKLRGMFQ